MTMRDGIKSGCGSVLLVVGLLALIGLGVALYCVRVSACRSKHPEAAAWACAVNP